MVAMEQSQRAVTTVEGRDEGTGRAAKKKKKRDKNHLGHLKIRKRKGSKMLNV